MKTLAFLLLEIEEINIAAIFLMGPRFTSAYADHNVFERGIQHTTSMRSVWRRPRCVCGVVVELTCTENFIWKGKLNLLVVEEEL